MKTTRRACLQAAAALPIARTASPAPAPSEPLESSFDPWIEVHPENLRHNVREVSRRAGARPILAVIKNNGYGLGVANVARVFEPMPEVAGFAVVKLHEAVRLRESGIKKPVLLMGPFDDRTVEEIAAKNILPMVYTPIGASLDRVARRFQKPVDLHVCVDTGLGREGVPYRAAGMLIRDIAGRKSARVAGTMMTFAEDPDFDGEQLRRFNTLCDPLKAEGLQLGRMHAASSFTLFQHPDAFLDMVRPGMALFGIYSEFKFRNQQILDLRPGVALRTRVVYVKQLRKDESAGYERVYRAKRDTWMATLPVGHADGVPRNAVNGAKVRMGDGLFPIVAISASHLIIEIGNDPRARIGDVATVFDWTPGSRPEDFGSACNASVYDLTMHLNPLLERRIAGATRG